MYPVKDKCTVDVVPVNIAVPDDQLGNSEFSRTPTDNKTAWIGLAIVSAMGAIWCSQILPLGTAVILISGLSVISLIALSKILFGTGFGSGKYDPTLSHAKTEGIWAWLPYPKRGIYHHHVAVRPLDRYAFERRRSLPLDWRLERDESVALSYAPLKNQRVSAPNQRFLPIEKPRAQRPLNEFRDNYRSTLCRHEELREFEKVFDRGRITEREGAREKFEREERPLREREFRDRERIVPRLE